VWDEFGSRIVTLHAARIAIALQAYQFKLKQIFDKFIFLGDETIDPVIKDISSCLTVQ